MMLEGHSTCPSAEGKAVAGDASSGFSTSEGDGGSASLVCAVEAGNGVDGALGQMERVLGLLRGGVISKEEARRRMRELSLQLACQGDEETPSRQLSSLKLEEKEAQGALPESPANGRTVPVALALNEGEGGRQKDERRTKGKGGFRPPAVMNVQAKGKFGAEQRRALVRNLIVARHNKRPLAGSKTCPVSIHMMLSDDAECTFKPQTIASNTVITCSPAGTVNASVAGSDGGQLGDMPSPNISSTIYERGLEMKRKMEVEAKAKREEAVERELSLCTFQPDVSAADEFHISNRNRRCRDGPSENYSVGDRLYSRGEDMARKKERLVEENMRREAAQHTFSPRLAWANNGDNKEQDPFAHVKPRYSKPTSRADAQKAQRYSFVPSITGIKPGMTAAIEYCKMPIAQRLHEGAQLHPPRCSSDSGPHGAGENGEEGGEDAGCETDLWATARSLPPTSPSIKKMEKRKTFSEFLSGLARYERVKQKKREQLIKRYTPSFTPALSEETRRIAEEKGLNRAEFLDRLGMSEMRRERHFKLLTDELERREKEICTFRPKIIDSPHVTLGLGSSNRRDHRLRLHWQRMIQDPSIFPTFQPTLPTALSDLAPHVPGKLLISNSLSTLMERIRERNARKERSREREYHQKAMKDLTECTFIPTVLPCPDFIKRSAESSRKLKVQRASQSKPKAHAKPEWR